MYGPSGCSTTFEHNFALADSLDTEQVRHISTVTLIQYIPLDFPVIRCVLTPSGANGGRLNSAAGITSPYVSP